MNSLPRHGNPEIRQLADRTNLDCDLKGDPKVEQFNPSSLASTEIAKLDRTSIRRPAPPPNSTSKAQPDTDKKERILGLSSVSTRVDKTILNRHLTGDPNDGQSNPTHQPHTAIPPLPPDLLMCSAAGPNPTTPPRITQTTNAKHRNMETSNQHCAIALTLPNLDDMRSSVYFHPEEDSASSSQDSITESDDSSDNESLDDDFLAGHAPAEGSQLSLCTRTLAL